MSFFDRVSSASSSPSSSQPSSSTPPSPISQVAGVATQELRVSGEASSLVGRVTPSSRVLTSEPSVVSNPDLLNEKAIKKSIQTLQSFFGSYKRINPVSAANIAFLIEGELKSSSAMTFMQEPVAKILDAYRKGHLQCSLKAIEPSRYLNSDAVLTSFKNLQNLFYSYKKRDPKNAADIESQIEIELQKSIASRLLAPLDSDSVLTSFKTLQILFCIYKKGDPKNESRIEAFIQKELKKSISIGLLASLNADSVLTSFRTLQTFFSSYRKMDPEDVAGIASTIQEKLKESIVLTFMREPVARILAESGNGDLHLNQVDEWNNQGQYEKTVHAVRKILSVSSFGWNVKAKFSCKLVFALEKLGRHSEALQEAQKCLNVSLFVDEDIIFDIYDYFVFALDDHEEVVAAARAALAFSISDENKKTKIYYKLLLTLIKLGKYDEALVEAQKCLMLPSLDNNIKAVFYAYVAILFKRRGENEGSIQAMRSCLALESIEENMKGWIYNELASALIRQGNFDEVVSSESRSCLRQSHFLPS